MMAGFALESAFNTRVIDGLTFQDYINYEAPLGTSLRFTKLFEEENSLSQILTEM
jgi:hypothetical protein